MPRLNCEIPQALQDAVHKRSRASGESVSHIVSEILSRSFDVPLHTLFQISISRALVQGLYERAVTTAVLLNYGNFGLGTFEGLDGEMVVLDGEIYQIRGDGKVNRVVGDVGTPFAFVLPFYADRVESIEQVRSMEDLTSECDRYRQSDNLFYAFRIDGCFSHIYTRAMKATAEGVPLAQAAANQPEFHFKDVSGTLVGIWAPKFSSALNVAGYHFHFLSDDRSMGGHLLGCDAQELRMRMEVLTDFHLSLPESAEFLQADLSKDTASELARAELARPKDNDKNDR